MPALYSFLLAMLVVLMTSGCPAASDEGLPCQRDQDCDEICSRLQECLHESNAVEVRLAWTIRGQAPSPVAPQPCGTIDALEVRFESDSPRDEDIAYYPVPCDLGRVFYDRMPNRLKQVQVSAVAEDGDVLDVVFFNIQSSDNNFLADFSP